MLIKMVVGLNAYILTVAALLQADFLGENVYRLLEQYPPLFIVAVVAYYMHKIQRAENATNREWLEKMLEIQRVTLKETYDAQNVYLSELIGQMAAQNTINSEKIEMLQKQLAVNTATVGEISAFVDAVSNRLDSL